jgi:hypothetical protein
MRKLVPILFSVLVASSAADAFTGTKTFMPPNNLDQEELTGGLTEAQFNSVIDKVMSFYGPIVQNFGATLTVDRRWTDNTVKASADQPSPTQWRVHMYGGLARRPEITEDGFAMVICHEIGHHLGGYPYVQDWAADEGEADLHATMACAQKVFGTNLELAAIATADLPDNMKAKCDAAHADQANREICYRGLVAGKSLADLLGALGSEPAVSFDTPDTSVVTRTNHEHPAAQCRLDTYVAGALCGNAKWDYTLIPGKSMANHNSMEAQAEAYAHSCETGEGARPKCWYAPLDPNNPDPGGEECPLGDPTLCDLMCQLDPSFPWCP